MTSRETLRSHTHKHPGISRGPFRHFCPAQRVLVPTHPVQHPEALRPFPLHPNSPRHSSGLGAGYSPHLRGDCKDQWSPEGTTMTSVKCRVCEDLMVT